MASVRRYEEAEKRSSSPWIDAHLKITKNRSMIKVSREFIEDAFNLYGLQQNCVGFKSIINIILGKKRMEEVDDDDFFEDGPIEDKLAEIYALIHQRYVLTEEGMKVMYDRYCIGYYGHCPCYSCNQTKLLPAGLSDNYGESGVVLFCPSCREVYSPGHAYSTLDGASFGTTFCNLFFLTYPNLIPPQKQGYIPTIFGYTIHPTSPYYTLSEQQKKKRN